MKGTWTGRPSPPKSLNSPPSNSSFFRLFFFFGGDCCNEEEEEEEEVLKALRLYNDDGDDDDGEEDKEEEDNNDATMPFLVHSSILIGSILCCCRRPAACAPTNQALPRRDFTSSSDNKGREKEDGDSAGVPRNLDGGRMQKIAPCRLVDAARAPLLLLAERFTTPLVPIEIRAEMAHGCNDAMIPRPNQ